MNLVACRQRHSSSQVWPPQPHGSGLEIRPPWIWPYTSGHCESRLVDKSDCYRTSNCGYINLPPVDLPRVDLASWMLLAIQIWLLQTHRSSRRESDCRGSCGSPVGLVTCCGTRSSQQSWQLSHSVGRCGLHSLLWASQLTVSSQFSMSLVAHRCQNLGG